MLTGYKYGGLQNQHQRPYPNSFHPVSDDYAGLMSSQEKQWLASIQIMQLSTNQPFQDDYYYQVSTNNFSAMDKIAFIRLKQHKTMRN